MEHRILWAAAIVLTALALVAGCVNVSVPKGPYVVAGEPRQPSPQTRAQVQAMDKPALEDAVLRLGAENDSLRAEVQKLKREKKTIEDRCDRLEDQVKDLRKR
jgi:predicted RNase H-like nuclease (RuvC/YqgF family)